MLILSGDGDSIRPSTHNNMARNSYFPPSSDDPARAAADDIRRREFAERVRVRMNQRNWSQSDLARAAGLKRDAISTYLSAKRWPSPASLKAMADALKTTTDDLLPSVSYAAPVAPALEINQDGDSMNLKINQRVTMEKAIRILAILKESDAAPVAVLAGPAKAAGKTPRRR